MMAVSITVQTGADSWSETAVRIDGRLVGIVSHPCSGADWFVHRAGPGWPPRERYKTRKAALASLSG